MPVASQLVCFGCGHRVPLEEAYPFRCPHSRDGDGVDHPLRRELAAETIGAADAAAIFDDPQPNPFLRYRRLLHSYLTARARGLSDDAYVEIVERLDAAVAAVGGGGFRVTPAVTSGELAAKIGAGELWIKDDTGNVTGTHKGRHLMGVMIWLELMERLGHRRARSSEMLGAASCGNAALAASLLARSGGRELEVFVPVEAKPTVIDEMRGHGARLVTCARQAGGPSGDPCFLRLQRELRLGVIPFTCQGSENGLIADGGATLVWELVSRLRRAGGEIEALFVQVGGGALGAACAQALREAAALGVIDRLPALYAVQTEAAYPFWRAWRGLVALLLDEVEPGDELVEPARAAEWAAAVRSLPGERITRALESAAGSRIEFMRPWRQPGASAAYSILDDQTYDWLLLAEGMLRSGGIPLVVGEQEILSANRLARAATGIPVDPTGSAGYAGCLALAAAGVPAGESVAVLFTGVERRAAADGPPV